MVGPTESVPSPGQSALAAVPRWQGALQGVTASLVLRPDVGLETHLVGTAVAFRVMQLPQELLGFSYCLNFSKGKAEEAGDQVK